MTDFKVSDTSGDDSVTLDTFAATHESPTVLKIDVEGAELAVLRGMRSILEADRPDILIEIHPVKLAARGHPDTDPVRLLRDADYTIRACDHRDETSIWKDASNVTRSSDETYLVWARPDECDRPPRAGA